MQGVVLGLEEMDVKERAGLNWVINNCNGGCGIDRCHQSGDS